YTPLGSTKVKKSDVRIIAATNRDLMDQVRKGTMREDLFYRIHIIPITLPALRERREDIPLLIEQFMKLFNYDRNPSLLPGKVMDAMYHYDWPGNVRELQNVLHRYVSLKSLDFMPSISTRSCGESSQYDRQIVQGDPDLDSAVKGFEKQIIIRTLEHNKWHRIRAAAALGISRNTLFRKMREYDLL
ncbi:MAG TPA: sigma-54-dependent Fis family transcriptional regulator, partial [Desulfobacteraceae bacterium]|nr:sigma-54-dependent Fis family transcriptional regulator [Desulfobacteraceae bacterium]